MGVKILYWWPNRPLRKNPLAGAPTDFAVDATAKGFYILRCILRLSIAGYSKRRATAKLVKWSTYPTPQPPMSSKNSEAGSVLVTSK